MAEYGVNIKVGVQGQNNVKQLGREIDGVVRGLDAANDAFTRFSNNLKSFDQRREQRKINEELDKTAEKYRELDRLQRQLRANDDSAMRAEQRQNKTREFISKRISEVRARQRSAFLLGNPEQYPSGANQPFEPNPMVAIRAQRDAEKRAIREIFNIESDLARKLNNIEIDLLQDKIKLEMDAQRDLFNNAIRLNKKEIEDFDRRLEERDRRRKARAERITLTGQTSPIDGAVGIPGSPAALRAAERARKIRSAQGSALIGGAFPLLFGQGLGASIGGGLGGFAGGMIGGEFGFGLSLVGTQIGSMFDQLVSEAAVLGQALNQNAFDYEKVAESVGLTGTSLNGLVTDLSSLEDQTEANALATALLATRVGDEGVQALEEFGSATQSLGNEFAIAMTLMQSEVAKFFRQVVQGAANNLREFNLLASGLTSKDPRQVKLTKQRAELLGQRDRLQADTLGVNRKVGDSDIGAINKKLAQVEQEIRDVQKEINADAGKRIRLAVELEKRTANELALNLQSAKTLDLRKQALAAEGEERLRLNAEAEKSALLDQFALDKQKLINRGKKGELTFRAVVNDLAQKKVTLDEATARVNKNLEDALDRITAKEDRRTKKAANEARRATKESEREQRAIDRANEALDRINRTYTNKLALQEASTELEAEMLKIDQRRAEILIKIEKLRGQEGVDPKRVDAAIEAVNAEATSASSGIFGNLGNIADMPGFASSIQMSNSLLLTQEEQVRKLIEKYPLLGEAADAAAHMMTFGIQSFVDGTKTAEEVFADFLRNIADMLFRTAQQMITQYIMLGIARAFSLGITPSIPSFQSGINSGLPAIGDYSGLNPGANFGGFVPKMALGGSVSSGRPYLVGERGPELFVPGAQGNIVPNNAMGSANVTVNVDASGSSVQGDGQNAAQLGKAIGLAVQTELRRQQRPGGILAR